jgi:pimeloyl-ACP methyl ester carboxylesterase
VAGSGSYAPTMSSVSSHTISNGDTEISVVTEGAGPLIVCVHGWPERWFSWRKQMTHFASLGFRVAAIDVRGYGGSSKPTDIASYRLTELCADVAAVVARLSDEPAILFGHDWGAPIVYNTARLHPEYVRAVAGLSVPYLPVGPTSSIDLWKQVYAERFFYQTYFQEPGSQKQSSRTTRPECCGRSTTR